MEFPKIVLVGKTGIGKSCTGNTILGRYAFQVSDSVESVTTKVQEEWLTRDGQRLHVIDTPGFDSNFQKGREQYSKTITDVGKKLCQIADEFCAVMFVTEYGSRFTEDENDVLSTIKSIFGENFMRNHGIVIFTHGEKYNTDNRRSHTTFHDWCSQQKGKIKELLDECNNRAVLFHNQDKTKAIHQVETLFTLIDGISKQHNTYKREMIPVHYDIQESVTAPDLESCLMSEDMKNYSFVRLADLQKTPINSSVNVLGVVVKSGAVSKSTNQRLNKKFTKRDLHIVDQSNVAVCLTLYGKHAENYDNTQSNPIIFVKNAMVSCFTGGFITLPETGELLVNPDLNEAANLLHWWNTEGKRETFINMFEFEHFFSQDTDVINNQLLQELDFENNRQYKRKSGTATTRKHQCVICDEAEVSMMTRPCNHVSSCASCVPRMEGKCPVCHREFTELQRVQIAHGKISEPLHLTCRM